VVNIIGIGGQHHRNKQAQRKSDAGKSYNKRLKCGQKIKDPNQVSGEPRSWQNLNINALQKRPYEKRQTSRLLRAP